MKFNLFKKIKNDKTRQELEAPERGEVASKKIEEGISGLPAEALVKAGAMAHRVLKGFYVSEKASLGNAMGQYVFRVSGNANKSEIKKEVSRLFDVKIKSVKVLNMPEKRRDLGKHPGTKSGFKKAIVVLEEGYTIGQAR